jgi:hypothetical protein
MIMLASGTPGVAGGRPHRHVKPLASAWYSKPTNHDRTPFPRQRTGRRWCETFEKRHSRGTVNLSGRVSRMQFNRWSVGEIEITRVLDLPR